MSRSIFQRWSHATISLGLAALAAAALVFPLGAVAPRGAEAAAAAGALVDDDVWGWSATAQADARIPVLVESHSGPAPTAGLEENTHRAERAADAVRRSGAAVGKHLALVGAVAVEVTPAQLRQLQADPSVAHVSADRAVHAAALSAPEATATSTPITYPATIGATTAWQAGLTGRGVGVAVLDTGIAPDPALGSRVVQRVDLVSPNAPSAGDPGGHGTHVAGIIGAASPGYRGVAPEASLVSVRVLDAQGHGRVSTVIKGLEWTVMHHRQLGIRVAVLAMTGSSTTSYRTDPLAAAVELAWHAGVAVVASAGNTGPTAGSVGSPANDPLVLSVGASDEQQTASTTDDVLAWFSSRGPTVDGLAKPDLVAPGRKIVSLRVSGSTLDQQLPTHREGDSLFRLTGTSEAAAVAAGAAAVLFQQRPDLDPNAVKALLKQGAHPLAGASDAAQGAGELDLARSLALETPSRGSARQHARPADGLVRFILAQLPPTERQALSSDRLSWDGEYWDRLSWDGLLWDRLSWDELSWDRLSWDRLSWDTLSWDTLSWDTLSWDSLSWDASARLD